MKCDNRHVRKIICNSINFYISTRNNIDFTTCINYNITTSDADAGDVLTITVTSNPTWLDSFVDNGDGTAVLSGTPANTDVGEHGISLAVTDGIDNTTQAYSITVEAALFKMIYLPIVLK